MDITLSNSFSTIKTNNPQMDMALKKFLSYDVRDYALNRTRTESFLKVDKKNSGHFVMTGLIPKIKQFLDNNRISARVVDYRSNPAGDLKPVLSLGKKKLFDFQVEAQSEFFKVKRGILKLPTGAGKTFTAVAAFKALSLPTLWVTHRTNLMYQTAKVFAEEMPDIKHKIGFIGDGQYNPNFITFATAQSIHSALKNNFDEMKQLLSQYQLLIVDEAHRMGAKSFFETVSFCSNAYYRLALTATPFMRNNMYENLMLTGTMGDIFYEVTPEYLINKGMLAQPMFKFVQVNSEPINKYSKDWKAIYADGIVNNHQRTQLIANAAQQLCSLGKKPLVIAQELAHCRFIKDRMDTTGLNFEIVTGKDKALTREKALNRLSSGKLDGIICSNIFDEGIDVEGINAVVMAGAGKSAPMLYQRVGRAARKKEKNNYCIIVDFIDNQQPILLKHSMIRYNMIKNQKGFKII